MYDKIHYKLKKIKNKKIKIKITTPRLFLRFVESLGFSPWLRYFFKAP